MGAVSTTATTTTTATGGGGASTVSDGVSEGGSGGAPHCEGHEEHDAGTRGEDEHRKKVREQQQRGSVTADSSVTTTRCDNER